jgi:hypothetical protein
MFTIFSFSNIRGCYGLEVACEYLQIFLLVLWVVSVINVG